MLHEQEKIIAELTKIPGVGIKTSEDLIELGIASISELKNKKPEKLYHDLCRLKGTKIDRCQLYVFRCAVYYASNTLHNPEKLKWWNWKD